MTKYILLLLTIFFLGAGRFLVVDNPQKADAIVVLAGSNVDNRFYRGLDLLRHDFAAHLFLDHNRDIRIFGHPTAEYATRFLDESAGPDRKKVSLCLIEGDSTRSEAAYIDRCLKSVGAKKALLITSDFHTRRASSIMRNLLPGYEWSVGASQDSFMFGVNWWKHREWAKTTLGEWERVIWWFGIERWTTEPIQ